MGSLAKSSVSVVIRRLRGLLAARPHRETAREQAETRLAAAVVLSVFVVLGTMIVAFQKPRAKVPKAVEKIMSDARLGRSRRGQGAPPRPSIMAVVEQRILKFLWAKRKKDRPEIISGLSCSRQCDGSELSTQ